MMKRVAGRVVAAKAKTVSSDWFTGARVAFELSQRRS